MCRTASPQSGGGGLVAESCPTLEIPWAVPHLGISVHGISQARIQEWVSISSSKGSSRPRDWTRISYVSCIGRQILYCWDTSFVAPNVYISRLSNCARWSNQTTFKMGSFVIFSAEICLGRALWGRKWHVISRYSCLLSPGTLSEWRWRCPPRLAVTPQGSEHARPTEPAENCQQTDV